MDFVDVCKKIFEGFKWAISLVAAAICFALAIYLALLDRVPAATLMAGLFVVLVLFHYLPQMESFKAFSVEAKMRANLSEAEDILAKIKEAAKVSAALAYHTLGWGSRMGHPVREKQAVADRVDALAKTLSIDPRELNEMKKDYLGFIKYDLYGIFRDVIYRARSQLNTEMVERLNVLGGENASPEARALAQRIQQLSKFSPKETDYPVSDLRRACLELLPPQGILANEDDAALRRFIEELVSADVTSQRDGRLASGALELIEQRSRDGIDKLYQKALGRADIG